jgi:fibronectin-binding autotransporter adhesin
MKKIILISFFLISYAASQAQIINCMNFCVLGIAIDTANDELDVTIYNGDTNHVNYPTVVVVDALGDTVGNINNTFDLFAQMPGDTVVHHIPTSLTSLPPGFTGTVYLTDQIWDTTCSFSYPMNCTVGIPELASSGSLSVYPNPASDNITIELNKINSNALISIYDITGKIVRTYATENNRLNINRDGLQSGLYLITVTSDNRRYTSKLVIR